MRKFAIIANSIKDPEGIYTEQIKNQLLELGATQVTLGTQIPDDTDAILVLGGDGTMLRAAGDTFGTNIPLLGVNLGTVGYLAEVDMADLKESFSRLINDETTIDDRMMLVGRVDYLQDGASVLAEDHCLNDIVITGCGALCLIRYELYVNGEFLNTYAADGLVISTPTGSTGYNMSAGGPIVEPRASLILVTPICPHTLNSRSIVLSAEDKITVRLCEGQDVSIAVQFDGREPYLVKAGDTINIYKSEQSTKIVKIRKESFLNTLHEKLV